MPVKLIDESHPDAIAAKAAEQKLTGLRKRLREKQDELENKHTEYMIVMSRSAHERISEQAAALLAGNELTAITRGDLERLQNECDVLKAAIAEQQRLVVVAQGKVSKALHEENKAAYVEIQRRIAAAVQELAECNEMEARFFEDLKDAGCTSIRFRAMAVKEIGCATDSQSRAAFHRREVAAHCPEAVV